MRYIKTFVAALAVIGLSTATRGSVIYFSDLDKDHAAETAEGVHITPEGPDDLPVVVGGLEVLGVTSPFLNNSEMSRNYAGIGTLDQPATRITLDVARQNNSGWNNPVTLIAFDDGKRVATTKVNLAPLGESTEVTVAAPAIDRFEWKGSGWVYHPYVIEGLQITSDTTRTPSVSAPAVGASPVPEPSLLGMIAGTGFCLIARRRGVRRAGR